MSAEKFNPQISEEQERERRERRVPVQQLKHKLYEILSSINDRDLQSKLTRLSNRYFRLLKQDTVPVGQIEDRIDGLLHHIASNDLQVKVQVTDLCTRYLQTLDQVSIPPGTEHSDIQAPVMSPAKSATFTEPHTPQKQTNPLSGVFNRFLRGKS